MLCDRLNKLQKENIFLITRFPYFYGHLYKLYFKYSHLTVASQYLIYVAVKQNVNPEKTSSTSIDSTTGRNSTIDSGVDSVKLPDGSLIRNSCATLPSSIPRSPSRWRLSLSSYKEKASLTTTPHYSKQWAPFISSFIHESQKTTFGD